LTANAAPGKALIKQPMQVFILIYVTANPGRAESEFPSSNVKPARILPLDFMANAGHVHVFPFQISRRSPCTFPAGFNQAETGRWFAPISIN
jgi:hypothetical protein